MKAKRFTEEQIIGILNEAEQTGNIREVCKRNNITETTFYRWRTKFGGHGCLGREAAPRARAGERPAQADGG
jgi:transposase-like protein